MNKRLLFLFAAVLVVAGAYGLSAVPSKIAKADVVDSILNFLRSNTITNNQGTVSQEVPLYEPAQEYESAVVKAVELASPSVVSIVVSKDLPIIEQCPYDPFYNFDVPPEFRGFFNFEFSQPCEKGVEKREVGGGSGFLISEDGYILTNKHVVSDEKAEYTVVTSDGKRYTASVLARDPSQDIAVIKAEGRGFVSARYGDSDSVKLGQTAIAIGNSLGEFRNTVSVGVISGLSRTITASDRSTGSELIQGVMQTDAAINPGNSGGPLLNLRGEVIGINTAIVSGAQNIGFAIPINQAKRAAESVKTTGEIKVPYIGVRYLTLSAGMDEAKQYGSDNGALVRGSDGQPGVVSGSPAEKAGLKEGDVILEVDGEKLSETKTLGIVVQRHKVGDVVSLLVKRGSETLTISVTLGERE